MTNSKLDLSGPLILLYNYTPGALSFSLFMYVFAVLLRKPKELAQLLLPVDLLLY